MLKALYLTFSTGRFKPLFLSQLPGEHYNGAVYVTLAYYLYRIVTYRRRVLQIFEDIKLALLSAFSSNSTIFFFAAHIAGPVSDAAEARWGWLP